MTSWLRHEKLTKSAKAVLAADLRGGNPEGHDTQQHSRSVHAVNQPVRLGQLGETREAPATIDLSLGEEEYGEKGCGKRQSDIGSDKEIPSLQLYPLAAESRQDHRITPRAPLSSTSPEWVPVRAKYASSR